MAEQANEEVGPSMSAQAIIVLCLLGAGALILCCWALFRHFFAEAPPPSPTGNVNADDGMTQTQYMRLVRLRNQEWLQNGYGSQSYYSQPHSSKGMMTQSSVMSV
ncbi:hypothetical protein Slin15195_G068570 [Septoria linicola]|uniref:Uncharacterized protein n=1 Tax=Septoria linicola TaxID=215465 RepID=A0A9Q9ELK4_9PEZI|nr:hypothetical protein Slin14017_G101320 [Septoria linicola]USW53538.1 hypothetical protein Slin15195_G068570 [Septoria linicola]